jgi:hypothetical protein
MIIVIAHEALPMMFFGVGLFALGILGLLTGFLMSLFGSSSGEDRAHLIFAFGVMALISGVWLMNALE